MLQRFRRIILDDTSDDDVIPCDLSFDGKNSHLSADDSCNIVSTKNKKLTANIGVTDTQTSHYSVNDSFKPNDEEECYTSDESYVEDSFLVKDCSDKENLDKNAESSSFSECIPSPEAKKLFPFSMALRSNIKKAHDSATNSLKSPRNRKYSVDVYSEKSNVSSSFRNSSDKITMPCNNSTTNTKIIKRNRSPCKNMNIPAESSSDSDETFEKYLRKTKEEFQKVGKTKLFSKEDIRSFVVNDDESVEVVSSSDEESGKVSDEQCNRSGGESSSADYDSDTCLSSCEDPNKCIRVKQFENAFGSDANSWKNLQTFQKEYDSSFDKRIFDGIFKDIDANGDVLSFSKREIQRIEVFLLALSEDVGISHPYAKKYMVKRFASVREELTKILLFIYRTICFKGMLKDEIKVIWNPRLHKTAGRCLYLKNSSAKIELSVKVCNKPDRVRDTLLHELCHAAVFLVDKVLFGRHGPVWQRWVLKCMDTFPRLPVIQRCHNYSIDAKFHYVCSSCGQIIKRHSKSLDLKRYRCGICRGNFVLHSANGKCLAQKGTRSNPFAKYVKENYAKYRRDGKKHAEVMKLLAEEFKQLSCGEMQKSNKISESDEKRDVC